MSFLGHSLVGGEVIHSVAMDGTGCNCDIHRSWSVRSVRSGMFMVHSTAQNWNANRFIYYLSRTCPAANWLLCRVVCAAHTPGNIYVTQQARSSLFCAGSFLKKITKAAIYLYKKRNWIKILFTRYSGWHHPMMWRGSREGQFKWGFKWDLFFYSFQKRCSRDTTLKLGQGNGWRWVCPHHHHQNTHTREV